MQAVEAVATRRGWDRTRHGKYPTTDMPLSSVPACERFVREAVFRRVLRALAPKYLPRNFLPELLAFRDAFYVRYSAAAGEQRGLEPHTDGSVFSFNISLSAPDEDFDGGGTRFEPSATTVRAPLGCAIGHSGQLRHSGVPITRGQRYLLVGFIGCVDQESADPERTAHDAFCRFGDAAWDRSPLEEPALVDGAASAASSAEAGVGPVLAASPGRQRGAETAGAGAG